MATLNFNKTFKNGWVGFAIPGVPGGVYIDKRTFAGDVPTGGSITIEGVTLKEPGAGVTEVDAAKLAAKLAKDTAKAEKAIAASAKAQERLAKLKASAEKAQAAVDAAKARAGAPAAESTGDVANL